jgi:hypothetical protein
VTSLLNRPSILHHNNQIGIAHRGQPVGNDDCGTALPQPPERNLYGCLAFGIECAGCLIQ